MGVFNFSHVTRACKIDNNRYENDAEHSLSLILIFFFLQKQLEQEFPHLNIQKIITLFAIHDIGEMGDGDIATWDKQHLDKEKEIASAYAELVTKMERADLFALYQELESNSSSIEIQVVKSIDRIAPLLLRIHTGSGWTDAPKEQATLAKVNERQIPRHIFSSTMMRLYNTTIAYAQGKGLLD